MQGNGANAFTLAMRALAQRRIRAALHLLDEAERGGHDCKACGGARWSCYMLLGRFEEAWQESARIAADAGQGAPDLWKGEPFHDKRVIVRCLHGFGDAIQFVRYAELLARDASRVIVQTQPELVSLMRAARSVDRAISWQEEDRRTWDVQIEVMELPRAFRTTLASVPWSKPYFDIPAEVRRRTRVPAEAGSAPRIGLQWGCGAWDPARSIPLRELAFLSNLARCELYSFQRGSAREEICSLPGLSLRDVSGTSPHVIEAAADLLHIDLLITVDTMLAHLAGALGTPVWVLLPFQANWRWMLGRSDSPWYPAMRLFRQSTPKNWRAAVSNLAVELERWLAEFPGVRPSTASAGAGQVSSL